VLNGLCRPFFGWVSDHIGRENTMFIAFGIEALGIFALATLGTNPVAFVVLSGVVFFGWGEIYSLFPATVTDTFGARYATANTGLMYTAKGTAALLVPVANVMMGPPRKLVSGVPDGGGVQRRRRGAGLGCAEADACSVRPPRIGVRGGVRRDTDAKNPCPSLTRMRRTRPKDGRALLRPAKQCGPLPVRAGSADAPEVAERPVVAGHPFLCVLAAICASTAARRSSRRSRCPRNTRASSTPCSPGIAALSAHAMKSVLLAREDRRPRRQVRGRVPRNNGRHAGPCCGFEGIIFVRPFDRLR
jgi:hypothetical protein